MNTPLTAVILAGGQSRRMGLDKADIRINGRSMLEHARLLASRTGAGQTIILGRPDHHEGVPDTKPHQGPARAIHDWLATRTLPLRLLVLPIDMPFLGMGQINALLNREAGAYFDRQYLPFYAPIRQIPALSGSRLKDLLRALGLQAIAPAPNWDRALSNINDRSSLDQLTREYSETGQTGDL